MLQFIFGKSASGKTYTVLEKIKEYAESDKALVLIVPEQFSFSSERAILKALGDSGALSTTVLSFSRLYDEVGRAVGGIAGKTLTDCDKVIFMKRALGAIGPELKLWKRYINSVDFAKTMLDTVGEMKINAVTPENLRSIAEKINNPTLKLKLCDLALVFETYDALLGERFIDPADTLTMLYRKLCDYNYFKGKTVFIDSFKGFTGQQYKLIERIISQAENVFVSLSLDTSNKNELNVFSNIKKAAESITAICKKYAVKIEEPIILGDSRFSKNGLLQLEKIISSKEDIEIENDGSVNICEAANLTDEVEFTTRTIRSLVRKEGYRYRDFVIIARDSEQYLEAMRVSAQKNGISVFFDNRVPLSAFPLAVAGQSAINAVNLSTENILKFHKTTLGTLTVDEIALLENYTFLWSIEGKMWQKEWDMNPKGLTTDAQNTETEELLAEINLLREKAVTPLLDFKNAFKGDAKERTRALFTLFEECGSAEKLKEMSQKLSGCNDTLSTDILKQSYDEYIKIFDSIAQSFGDTPLDTKEYSETLSLAVALSDVGVIPQTLDEVTFGSADRIRTLRPKIAFILGANQGVFPRNAQNNGIFGIGERKLLIENGIAVADNSVYSSIDEEYLVYSSLCSASEKIYISYHKQSLSGETLEPSTFVSLLKSRSGTGKIYEPQKKLGILNAPETEAAALSEFCKRVREDKTAAISVKSAMALSETAEKIEFIENALNGEKKEITPKTAAELFGSNIGMSASRLDTFNRCRFSYFCRYGLKAQKIQPADFDVMQRGTIVHFVLERLINDYMNGETDFNTADFDALTDSYIKEYLNSVQGFESVKNARTEFLISRIARSLKEVVRHVAEEILQSDFCPQYCELKIGEDKPLIFPFDGGKIFFSGSIDRVDKYNGYIRIIDYKTGSKSFKLPDILFGLNLQMLIYLYAITRGAGLSDDMAAGILYQPSRRNINDNNLAMNGLLQSDEALYSAMEKIPSGKYVPPLSFNKDGSLSKRCTSYIEKEGFTAIFDYIERLIAKTGNTLSMGDIAVSPLDGRESPACKYCDYSGVCGIENSEIPRVPDLNNDEVFEFIKEAEENGI